MRAVPCSRSRAVSKHPAPSVARAAALALFGAGLVTALCLTQRISVVDDAYISYRYVLNLVDAHQLVFNLGERVEGATNLLWILILAIATVLTGLKPAMLAVALSLLLYGYAVGCVAHLGKQLTGSLAAGICASATVFLNADVFLTATNGLESALYMALLAEAFACLAAGRGLALGVVLGLLFATRPEGAAIGIALIGMQALIRGLRPTALRSGTPWLAIVAAVTLARLVYFGSWIPNSVVAKSYPLDLLPLVLSQHSWPYLRGFLVHDPVLTLIGAAMMVGTVWVLLGRCMTPSATAGSVAPLVLPCATLVVLIAVVVATRNGGDWMEHWRLLTQYAPAFGVGLAALAQRLPRGEAIPALTLAGSLAMLPMKDCCGVKADIVPPGEFFAEAARRLTPIVRPGDVVSAEAAGLLPYRLIQTRIHDPTGLLDPFIARHGRPAVPYGKTDIDYTFGTVRPEFMVWHWAGHVQAASPALRAAYRGLCYRFCEDRLGAMVVLVRSDRLDDAVSQAFAGWADWPLD